MHPITGPFGKTETALGPPTYLGFRPQWWYRASYWYRQTKPYNLPLSYTMTSRRVLSNTNSLFQRVDIEDDPGPGYLGTDLDAFNKAYPKFRESAYSSASLGITLAEHRQSMNMIAARGLQLLRFTNAIRGLRFYEAAKHVGLLKPPRNLSRRRGAKAASNNWLEFHFGWSPLIADIYAACDVLSSRIPIHKAEGRASAYVSRTYGPDGNGVTRRFYVKTASVIIAEVSVSNPNLALATRLGLTNPATIAWELVPFSFVVDWFVNVSDFLSSFTDFAGFAISNPQRTLLSRATENRTGRPPGAIFQAYLQFVNMSRSLGPIPGPTLRVRSPWTISPTRALTSVSLLIQRLPS